jgi:hypothetical protein
MSLFQESIVRKHLGYLDQEVIDQAYIRFKEVYSANKIANIKIAKEEQYQEGFIKDIFGTVLGYSVFPEQPFNIQTEKKNVADSKKADGAIFQGEDVVGVIELKDNKTKNLDAVKDQAFGYKNNHKECSYVISSNFHKLRFYIDDATEYEEFDLYNLDKETFKRFYLYLRKEGLLDKNIPKLLRQETKFHEENITKNLYKDYSSFKNTFFQNVVKNNPQYDKLILFKKSQKFLDKVLFVLFAEDKGLVNTNSIVQIIEKWQDLKNDTFDTAKPLYQLVSLFFNNLFIGKKDQVGLVLIPEFGGEIFAPDEVLDNLIIDDDILKDDLLKLSRYDFNTEVDVNILGHIFEHSLSEIEEVEAELKGEVADKSKGKRKKDGVFYTPKYITRYIVENTVGKLCAEKKMALKLDIDIAIFDYQKPDGKLNTKGIVLFESLNKYKDWLLTLKILDPACGSGAFLNEAVNFLVHEHQFIDDLIAELTNTPLRLFDTDIAILENNIYGVDINEESIEIAKLSLWLRTAKQGRKLSNLTKNIKCGNSLIDEPKVAGDKSFKWKEEFPEVFSTGGFDVVIGNPPWGAKLNALSTRFLVNKYPLVPQKLKDTYLYFMLHALDILKKNGLLGFIVPNTWLLINNTAEFRKHILSYNVNNIIDHGDGVFQDAIVESSTIILVNNQNDKGLVHAIKQKGKKEIINHFTEKSIWLNDPLARIVIELNNNKYELIRKLEKNSDPFEKDCEIIFGIKPYQVGHGNPIQTQEMVNDRIYHSPYMINENWVTLVTGTDVNKYSLDFNDSEFILYGKNLMYPSNENKIKSEKILLRRTSSDLRAVVDNNGFYPQNSLFIITSTIDLYFLVGLMNSSLFNFIYKTKCPQEGKIFAEVKPSIIKTLPIIQTSNDKKLLVKENATKIQELSSKLEFEKKKFKNSLSRKFNLIEVPKKLQYWYQLSYSDFIKELNKKKIKLSLSEEAEWETYFTIEAKKINDLKVQIEKIVKNLDQFVYKLYELTEDEIKLVENE